MKKTTIVTLAGLMMLMLAACSGGGGLKKTKSGLLYQIFSDGKGQQAKKGEFLKVHFSSKVRDSVMASTFGKMPTYAQVDSVGPVYHVAEIFPLLHKGDSAVVVILADSLLKKSGQLPDFIHRKDKITITFKVLDIFANSEHVDKDQRAEADKEKASEVKTIGDYLAKNNIKAQKTEKGTFVVIDNPGQGPAADSGKLVKVKYRGQTFAGKVFDSNLDSTFGHTEPYGLVIGSRGSIEGWDDGLRLFKKGGKGKLYIPSLLAYGPNPPQGSPFKPFDNLIFDVEVVDITDAPATPAQPGMTPATAPTAPGQAPKK